MRLALDTNAYRAHIERNTALIELSQSAEGVGLPIVVLGELRFGFMNGIRLEENERILARFLEDARTMVLNLTQETTRLFGELATLLRRAGVSLSQNDVWIAALCKQYDYTLATRDRDFRSVTGLRVFDF